MLKRLAVSVTLLALLFLVAPTPANAKVHFGIYYSGPGVYTYPSYSYYAYPYPYTYAYPYPGYYTYRTYRVYPSWRSHRYYEYRTRYGYRYYR